MVSPRPVPLSLVVEVEYAPQILGRDARAVVGEDDTDTVTRAGRADGEAPAALGLKHGLLGVDDDVEEDLLELVRVGQGLGELGVQVHLQADVLQPQVVAAELQDTLEKDIEVHQFLFGLAAASKGEEVLDDLCRSLRFAEYGLDLSA